MMHIWVRGLDDNEGVLAFKNVAESLESLISLINGYFVDPEEGTQLL
jgi:hypothetical protein